MERLAERYILLDSLLSKLVTMPEKETALLVIPEICGNKKITLYHSSLFVGHQGVLKTYLTIWDTFFILRSNTPAVITYKKMSQMPIVKK